MTQLQFTMLLLFTWALFGWGMYIRGKKDGMQKMLHELDSRGYLKESAPIIRPGETVTLNCNLRDKTFEIIREKKDKPSE